MSSSSSSPKGVPGSDAAELGEEADHDSRVVAQKPDQSSWIDGSGLSDVDGAASDDDGGHSGGLLSVLRLYVTIIKRTRCSI